MLAGIGVGRWALEVNAICWVGSGGAEMGYATIADLGMLQLKCRLTGPVHPHGAPSWYDTDYNNF